MARHFADWISTYMEYASFSEAPPRMHFFCGASAVAGALRRRVWINQAYFTWHANLYVILVAPPAVVSKSSTAAIAMNILREVVGVNFGPDVVTWPALVSAFEEVSEMFPYGEDFYPQSALTLESSEFGNLINPADRDMIDLLVTLWDSRTGVFKKLTKTSGKNNVENPWINLIACTTPAWIAGNFPDYVIGGGFTSRCLFVYADKKEKLVPYPALAVPPGLENMRKKLAEDLNHIANTHIGPYALSSEAVEWGKSWYQRHNDNPPENLPEDLFGGYLARKQTHIHKLAMVLAAAQRDEMVIEADDLSTANTMISDVELELPEVFNKIGRTQQSVQAERFIKFVHSRGAVSYEAAYRFIHTHFPMFRDFETMLHGAIRSGLIQMVGTESGVVLKAHYKEPPPVKAEVLPFTNPTYTKAT